MAWLLAARERRRMLQGLLLLGGQCRCLCSIDCAVAANSVHQLKIPTASSAQTTNSAAANAAPAIKRARRVVKRRALST